MLARLARELPAGSGYFYEPKWDGFRCVSFRDQDVVDLRSRSDRPLARYFPEVAEALRQLPQRELVLDGELVVFTAAGKGDFAALMGRLHPAASRVEQLRRTTPATYIVFDVLAVGEQDVTGCSFEQRRDRLQTLGIEAVPGLALTPTTDDVATARGWLEAAPGGAMDGVVVKTSDLAYQPGRRAMLKVKQERTADVVIAGMRLFSQPPRVSSLLLGLWDDTGEFRHIGVVQSFSDVRRVELLPELRDLVAPLAGHPWEHGFALEGGPLGRLKGAAGRWAPGMTLDWVPLRPVLVAEVAYDQVDGIRFRHPARFRRWRPDREPASCTTDQLRTR